MLMAGLFLFGFSLLAWFVPGVVIYPLVFLLLWISLALLYRSYRLKVRRDNPSLPPFDERD